ncbi:very short patch repair endonuclease [Marinobacter sp. CHS3-4]|uniref:very short patch repair endonuclease n=1 Tax=Marinobacter sp. CHS3-4 TaxID=3045174 RepID=UPI0024B4AD3E|nr:very short patch repair endonuclease [Marinobacter sp. CHS3-4]MDI9245979.1 very short patch repair endonuclease [Marinobacter sp. CHS3-4]
MADVHDKETRSRNMAAIKGKGTKPEIWLQARLSERGFDFQTNLRDLPGSPDIVLDEYKAVVFFHSCFWHAHGCSLSNLPENNRDTWEKKFSATKERDSRNKGLLKELDWRVLEVWECSLRGTDKLNPDSLIDLISEWIQTSTSSTREITGTAPNESSKTK